MNLSSPTTIVALVIYVLFGLVILFGFLRGLRKGFYKSIMDIGFVVLGILLSFVISKLIVKSFIDIDIVNKIINALSDNFASNETVMNILNGIREYMANVPDGSAISMVLALPVAIATPILFIVIYILLGIILKIPKLIIERVLFGKNGGEGYRGGNRLLGGACGAVRKILSLAVLLIPLVGFLNLVSGTMETISKSESSPSDIVEANDEYIMPVRNNVALKAVYNCGGKFVFNSLSTVKVNKVKVSLSKEVNVLASIYSHTDAFTDDKPEDYGDKQIGEIDEICEIIDDAQLIPTLIAEAAKYTSDRWVNGEDAFGFEKPIVGEYYNDLFNEILSLFNNMSASSAKRDVKTIASIGKECIGNGLVRNIITKEDTFEILSSEEFLDKVLVEIYDNENMRPAIPLISKTLVNYVYKVYDNVNGTTTPYPQPVDMSNVTRDDMMNEGKYLSIAIKGISSFEKSIDGVSRSDASVYATKADLAALGDAFDAIHKSKLFGMGYEFIVNAVMHSEICTDMKFVDDEMIEKALQSDTSMKELLVNRQRMIIVTMSLTGRDIDETTYKNVMKDIISDITPESADAMKSTFSKDKLLNFGMSEEQADTMSKVLTDITDSAASVNENLTEEEKKEEADSLDKFMSSMISSKNSDSNEWFSNDSEESKTGMTSDEFVDCIINSKILTETVKLSSNENKDAYGVAETLSDKDKSSIKASLQSKTNDSAIIESISAIFGL